MMFRYAVALCALALVCPTASVAAQTITATAPLPDSDGDGRIVVNKTAVQLGVPKGTVLTRCGTTLVYVGPKSVCPSLAAIPAVIAAPVITAAPKDFGTSGQIGYGDIANVHATRAMDAFPLRVTSAGKTIQDIVLDQGRQFVTPEKGAALTINDVKIARVDAKVTKRGILIRGDSARWDIGNFRLAYIAATDTGDYPMGIQIGVNATETAHDITIHDGYISGFKNSLPAAYPNADGIDCEHGTYRITITRVTIEGVTDGAVDCKAAALRMDDVTAISTGHRSFRLWGSATTGTITSINPGWAHVWVAKTGTATIGKLVAVGSAPLIDTEAGAIVTVQSCDLTGWTGTVRVKGPGKVTLGAGCTR